MLEAHEVRLDWDENGLHMIVEHDGTATRFLVLEVEELYETVNAKVGPWMAEKRHAETTFRRERRSPDYGRQRRLDPYAPWVTIYQRAHDAMEEEA
jgi:hypothetical protein